MNKTLLSTAIAMALGVSAQAWANPTNNADTFDNNGDAVQTATSNSDQNAQTGAAANEYSHAYQNSYNPVSNSNNTSSFNTSSIKATTELNGSVYDNRVRDIGNNAYGGERGGDGGMGGNGGNQEGYSKAYGANGGDGGSGYAKAYGGDTFAGDAGNGGVFDASNSIDGSLSNGAGIITVSQNSGMNSLTQQGITVQANLTVQ